MDNVRAGNILPFFLRGFFLLLLLPLNVLFVKMAYQKLAEPIPLSLPPKASNASTEETFSAELKNGVNVSVKYGNQQTILEAKAGDRLFSVFDGENGLSIFRTNLNDDGTWFQDMFMIPSWNTAYHDSWFFEYNGDQQFDAMSDPENGDHIHIGDRWESCKLDTKRRIATMLDGIVFKWNGTRWSKQEGGDHSAEKNMADR